MGLNSSAKHERRKILREITVFSYLMPLYMAHPSQTYSENLPADVERVNGGHEVRVCHVLF